MSECIPLGSPSILSTTLAWRSPTRKSKVRKARRRFKLEKIYQVHDQLMLAFISLHCTHTCYVSYHGMHIERIIMDGVRTYSNKLTSFFFLASETRDRRQVWPKRAPRYLATIFDIYHFQHHNSYYQHSSNCRQQRPQQYTSSL